MGAMTSPLAALIVALSPIAGYIIGKFAQEEMAPGRKYFEAMKHVLFISAAAVLLYAQKWDIYVSVAGLTAVFAYLVFKQARIAYAVEVVYGIAFALASTTPMFFLFCSLVFLYGLPAGSLFVRGKRGLLKSVLAGLLFFLFSQITGYIL